MKILAIETSTDFGTCALWRDGVLEQRVCPSGRPHSETLLPLLRVLVADAGIGFNQLDGIAFGSIIREIDQINGVISSAVEEQGAATREIASNAGQVADSISSVNGAVREVLSAAAMQTRHSAGDVLSTSHLLSAEVLQLKGRLQTFLDGIR